MRPNLAVFVRIPRYTFALSERPLGDNSSVLVRAKAFAANRPARDMRVKFVRGLHAITVLKAMMRFLSLPAPIGGDISNRLTSLLICQNLS
jgi:hypothetical protein